MQYIAAITNGSDGYATAMGFTALKKEGLKLWVLVSSALFQSETAISNGC